MRIRLTLLSMLLPLPLSIALGAAFAMLCLTCFSREALRWNDLFPLAFLAALALAYTRSFFGPGHRYARTRGFSSACIWAHTVLVGTLALTVALLPPSLVVWMGARSSIQSITNPLFPLMAPVEMNVPFFWWGAGLLLMTAALFGSIRAAQPHGRRGGGPLILAAVTATLFAIAIGFFRLNSWQFWCAVAVLSLVGFTLLLVSRPLHRSMEVS